MPTQSFLAFGYPVIRKQKCFDPKYGYRMDIEETIKRVRTGDTTALKKTYRSLFSYVEKGVF